ncbi:MAG: hypothetical protein ACE145_09565 [Terriglobia bacterium]
MRVVTYKGERNLSDVARRVFQIKGPKSAELTKQAAAALLRVNPHLGELKNLREGTPIIVPALPGVGAAATQPGVSDQVVAQLRATLKDAESVLGQSLAREADDAKAMARLAQDKDLKMLAKQLPEVREKLAQTLQAVESRLKDVEARTKVLTQGLGQLQKDIDELNGT